MNPGDFISVKFPDRVQSGTVKAADASIIIVQEAPGFVFYVRYDSNLGRWMCGKVSVTFEVTSKQKHEMTRAEFRTKLFDIYLRAQALHKS